MVSIISHGASAVTFKIAELTSAIVRPFHEVMHTMHQLLKVFKAQFFDFREELFLFLINCSCNYERLSLSPVQMRGTLFFGDKLILRYGGDL